MIFLERKFLEAKSEQSTAVEHKSSSVTSNKRAKNTDGNMEPPRYFEMVSKDRRLLEEFGQESETIFCQDDTCYEHYKEIQRENK